MAGNTFGEKVRRGWGRGVFTGGIGRRNDQCGCRRRRGEGKDHGLLHDFDGFHGHRSRHAFVAYPKSRRTVLVDPAGLEASVLALVREEGTEVDLVADPDGVAHDHSHGELEGVSVRTDELLNPNLQQWFQERMEIRVWTTREEAGDTPQETFSMLVVPGPVEVGPVEKDFVYPVQSLGKLAASTMHVEERECINADDRVESRSSVIKVGLEHDSANVSTRVRTKASVPLSPG